MLIISHRGNLDGPQSCDENHPDSINAALNKGFYAEVDVWGFYDKLVLGHDFAEHEFCVGDFVENCCNIFFHAKNLRAAEILQKQRLIWFSHNSDDFAVVSNIENKQVLWGVSGKLKPSNLFNTIVVSNKISDATLSHYGICTDWPQKVKEIRK